MCNIIKFSALNLTLVAAAAANGYALTANVVDRADTVRAIQRADNPVTAHLGHNGVVKQLIAAGAPLDRVNNLHWTVAIRSVVLVNHEFFGSARHQETLRALIKAGANLQLTDRQGNTSLQLAIARGYAEMVKMLSAPAR